MATSYTQFSMQSASQKITLVHLDMKREVKVFTTVGTTHTRQEDFYVVAVEVNGSAGTFVFTPENNQLAITFDGDIAAQEVIVTYRLFLADFDVITTHDLTLTGNDVQYKGFLKRAPGLSTALNFSNSNKTVVGSGNLELDNSTGFFNEILESYRLENKEFSAYSWSPTIPINEHKTIYRGTTNQARIAGDNLRLSVKDSLFGLNSRIILPKFSSSEVNERDINRFKKSVFGRVNGMGIQSIDQNGAGYTGSGSLSGTSGNNFIEGTNTNFLSEIVPRDKIIVNNIILTVRKVVDDSYILLSEPLTAGITGAFTVDPIRQYNNKNRIFSVANHALKKFSTTITAFVDFRRIQVADADGFIAGDTVIILNEAYLIERISQVYTDSPTNSMTADVIVLTRTLSGNNFPSIGATVETKEVANVLFDEDAFLDASVAVTNADNTETTITLASNTEQVIAPEGFLENTLTTVANTPYYVLGTPAIQSASFAGTLTDFRGSYIQLANTNDTAMLSGPFVVFSNAGEIRQFTSVIAPTVEFLAGDLYQLTDGANANDYFLVRTAGVNMDHQNLGSDLPIRVNLTAAESIDYNAISLSLRRTIADSRVEQLFAFDSAAATAVNWTLLSNIGNVGITNSIVLATSTGTVLTTSFTDGIAPNINESIGENTMPRDLIRIFGEVSEKFIVETQSSYVEVSTISSTTLSGTGIFKNPNYIQDNSLITCSAFGQTFEGTIAGDFIKTAADVCRKLLIDNGLTAFINTTTFTDAALNEPLSIGIYAPYSLRMQPPTILDLINKTTLSTLGGVGLDEDFLFKFQLLNGFKPTTLDTIRVIRNNDITNEAREVLNPSPLFRYTLRNIDASYDFGENTPNSKLIQLENARIGRLTDLNTTEEVDLYLRDLTEATNIADRFLNYSQRFNRIVSFRGSLALANVSIGDIVLLDFLELRNQSREIIPFLGMVTEFSRDGKTVAMSVDDFGGLFLRSVTLSDAAATTFALSDATSKILDSFLTDDNGLIDNNESTLGFNILP